MEIVDNKTYINQTNKMVLQTLLSSKMIAQYLAENIYSIFKYDITKRKFMEDVKKWLDSDATKN